MRQVRISGRLETPDLCRHGYPRRAWHRRKMANGKPFPVCARCQEEHDSGDCAADCPICERKQGAARVQEARERSEPPPPKLAAPPETETAPPVSKRKGRSKLSDEERAAVWGLREKGFSIRQLARIYGVGVGTIQRALKYPPGTERRQG